MFEEIRKRKRKLVEFDSVKVTTSIPNAGKTTGDFAQRRRKNGDLVESYIRKLDWKTGRSEKIVICPIPCRASIISFHRTSLRNIG